jgi:hypothetical protein
MCPLRCRSAQLLIAAAILPLAALAGCAADARHLATASVPNAPVVQPVVQPALPHALRALLIGDSSLSDDEAEMVVARATAAHEMSRP